MPYSFRAKSMQVILFVFTLFYTTTSTSKLDLHELKRLLTKSELQGWFNDTYSSDSPNPYCHLCCITVGVKTVGKQCGSHTMCQYADHKIGTACKGYIAIEFEPTEQQAIVDAHNTLRNLVAKGDERRGKSGPQPPAANMRAVEWNSELAQIAQRWAAQCVYSNDVCRDLERFPVGQSIAKGNLATNSELSFIKQWFDEVQGFNKSEVPKFIMPPKNKHVAADYTQLVWADTYQIGCARAVFQEPKGTQVIYREHFICNYGPTGNIPNQPVYKVGSPCSACHEGTGCTFDYPALCSGKPCNGIGDRVNRYLTDYMEPKEGKVVGRGYDAAPDTFSNMFWILHFIAPCLFLLF